MSLSPFLGNEETEPQEASVVCGAAVRGSDSQRARQGEPWSPGREMDGAEVAEGQPPLPRTEPGEESISVPTRYSSPH